MNQLGHVNQTSSTGDRTNLDHFYMIRGGLADRPLLAPFIIKNTDPSLHQVSARALAVYA